MDATSHGFARRCLPLVVANHAGWVVRAPFGLRATWSGSDGPGGIDVRVLGDGHPASALVSDHFGYGILTFNIPFVFRTPAGVGLSVRGAPNFWIEGAHPLEGLVETDWATVTFTMNWKLLRPGRPVEFRQDDPICFLQPIDLGLIEAARPEVVDIESDAGVAAGYHAWARSRSAFLADGERRPGDWQRDYFIGGRLAGPDAPVHRTTVAVRPFDGAPAALVHIVDGQFTTADAVNGPALVKREPTSVTERGAEFVLTDADGAQHRLNATALFVLEACTGENSYEDIVEMVRVAFSLDDPPGAAVGGCLADLLRAGLVDRPG
jgi:hypothetical protein